MFKIKNFVIFEVIILLMALLGYSMHQFGFLKEVLGMCNFLPSGSNTMFVPYCSDVYGRLMSLLFFLMAILYFLVFIIFKLVHRFK